MPLPLALLAAPGFGVAAKAFRGVKKLLGGRKRRRRRRRAQAQAQAQYSQQARLMGSVPRSTAVGRGLQFIQQQAEPFLGIGSKKKQAEAVAKAQTPEELLKKYWWIIAVVFGILYLKKMKIF